MANMIQVVCSNCGQNFERRHCDLTRSGRGVPERIYCSKECMRSGRVTTCEVCGKQVYRKRSELDGRPCRWCSRECADIGRKRGETRICETCGKSFYAYPSHLGSSAFHKARYCSRECYYPSVSERLRGVPKSAEHCRAMSDAKRTRWHRIRDKYMGPRWHIIRKEIRERDNHTCQDCGKHQVRPGLDVHHIRPLVAFGDDFAAGNHPSNLVALCKSCHSRRDNFLGRSRGIDLSTL